MRWRKRSVWIVKIVTRSYRLPHILKYYNKYNTEGAERFHHDTIQYMENAVQSLLQSRRTANAFAATNQGLCCCGVRYGAIPRHVLPNSTVQCILLLALLLWPFRCHHDCHNHRQFLFFYYSICGIFANIISLLTFSKFSIFHHGMQTAE